MDIDTQLRDIRSRITQKQSQQARAQVGVEQAVQQRDEAARILREEFGATNGAEVRAAQEKLDAELAETVASIETQLNAAGA